MKNKFGIFLLTACCTTSVHGQLTVTSGDFVNNEYSYATPFSPTNSSIFASAHAALVETQSGTSHIAEGNGTQYISPLSGTGSSFFTYRFDFSETRPTQVSISDEILIFNNVASNSSLIDISYSINGTDFIGIRGLNASNTVFRDLLASRDTYTIDFEQEVSSFFYRVGFDSNTDNSNQNQFGRAFESGNAPFSATFTAIPEPSSVALSGLALVAALSQRKRK